MKKWVRWIFEFSLGMLHCSVIMMGIYATQNKHGFAGIACGSILIYLVYSSGKNRIESK